MSSVSPFQRGVYPRSTPHRLPRRHGSIVLSPQLSRPTGEKGVSPIMLAALALSTFVLYSHLLRKFSQLPIQWRKALEVQKQEMDALKKFSKLEKALAWIGALTGPTAIGVAAIPRKDTIARGNAATAIQAIKSLDSDDEEKLSTIKTGVSGINSNLTAANSSLGQIKNNLGI